MRLIFAVASTLILATSTINADEVYVPIGQQGADKQTITRPQQGMTKSQVEKQFGKPNSWRDAVGDPPISSWQYEGFTVYFEYSHVIHSVLNH